MRPTLFGASLACLACLLVGCRSPYYADRGALAGGLTGAGVGALVGAGSDNPVAGALIGGAVGTAAGAIVGDSIDQDIARNNAEIEAKMGQRLVGAATSQDVINMSHAGLSEEVIATHIQTNGLVARPSASELIVLKNQGVSDRVIQAMQTAPLAGQRAAVGSAVVAQPVYAAPPPVVVQEHIYWGPPHRHYWHPHHHHHHRPRVGWSVGISGH